MICWLVILADGVTDLNDAYPFFLKKCLTMIFFIIVLDDMTIFAVLSRIVLFVGQVRSQFIDLFHVELFSKL